MFSSHMSVSGTTTVARLATTVMHLRVARIFLFFFAFYCIFIQRVRKAKHTNFRANSRWLLVSTFTQTISYTCQL